jgi:hypothetical protein
MKHSLPTEIINELLAFLDLKPYREAAPLIHKIQQNAVQLPEESAPSVPEAAK